jgi:cystathionine beta-synthase
MIYNNILETVGDTPVVRLNRIAKGAKATVLAKLESFNPGNSVKDRAALAIITDAERRGLLKPGGTIIEATSGNTGIGLAMVAAVKGYRTKLVVVKAISEEKMALLKAYGAEVIVAENKGSAEMEGSHLNLATKLANETPNSFLANQYYNKANPKVHYEITGPEIWRQTEGKIDVFVASMGTGGTISGISRYLKEKNRNIRVVGVEPEGSIFSGGKSKHYEIEGIGQCFFPGTLDLKNVDEIIRVGDVDAFNTARRLAMEEGIMAGESSGAAVYAAISVAKKLEGKKTVLVLLPDTGRNYLSTMFSDDWMRRKFPKWRAPR